MPSTANAAKIANAFTPEQRRALRARTIERDAVSFLRDIGLKPKFNRGHYRPSHDMFETGFEIESVEVTLDEPYFNVWLTVTQYAAFHGGYQRAAFATHDERGSLFLIGNRAIMVWKADGLNGVDLMQF